jgi:hypothetical protein
MTDDARDVFEPNFRDRARAVRLVHAVLSEDVDMMKLIVSEPKDAADITYLILSLADEVVVLLRRRTDINPFHLVEDRIRAFLDHAEHYGQ